MLQVCSGQFMYYQYNLSHHLGLNQTLGRSWHEKSFSLSLLKVRDIFLGTSFFSTIPELTTWLGYKWRNLDRGEKLQFILVTLFETASHFHYNLFYLTLPYCRFSPKMAAVSVWTQLMRMNVIGFVLSEPLQSMQNKIAWRTSWGQVSSTTQWGILR